MENREKDRWDKADIILKALGTLLIPSIIAIIAIVGNSIIQNRQDIEMKTRLYSELMSKREEAESSLRKDMFKSILDSVLDPKSSSAEENVLKLELLSYNFHESLNLQPLFSHVIAGIASSKSIKEDTKEELMDRLRNVAGEIVCKQMLILEASGKKFSGIVDLDETAEKLPQSSKNIAFPKTFEDKIRYESSSNMLILNGVMSEEERDILLKLSLDESFKNAVQQLFQRSQTLKNKDKGFMFTIGIEREDNLTLNDGLGHDIERHFKVVVLGVNFKIQEIKIRLEVIRHKNGKRDLSEEPSMTEFWLGFFDFPMIDNTRLSDDQRCALILTQFEDPVTKFTLVYFPGSRASIKEKLYYEEVVKKLVAPHLTVVTSTTAQSETEVLATAGRAASAVSIEVVGHGTTAVP